MGTLLFDLRDAFRGLRRDRAYAATVIVTLAIVIGATTAVFSIVNGVLLKPLAFRESHRLVALAENWAKLSSPWLELNEQHFEYWRTHATSFESMAQYIALPGNMTGAGDATEITIVRASGTLFDVLGVEAALGRRLTVQDEPSAQPNVTVITDRLWRTRFGADPRVIGRAIGLNGRSFSIVGVLPASFRLPEVGRLTDAIDAFVPYHMDTSQVGWVGEHDNAAIGRLKAGVTPEQAHAELDRLQADISVLATKEAHEPVVLASRVVPLAESIVGTARRGLLLLMAAIGAVLLIACSNLANLSLTRTLSRIREASIRSALGASQARLVGRAVLEQIALAIAGGALGIWVASVAIAAFVRTAPVDLPRVGDVTLDGRVLLFAAFVSIATGVLVAALPARRISRTDVQEQLRASGPSTTTDRSGMRTRGALVAAQVALTVALLVVTALLTVSFVRVMHVDRGFVADNVLTIRISLPASRYPQDDVRRRVFDRVLAAASALPGVDDASFTSATPLSGTSQVNFIAPEGSVRPRSEQPTANFRSVAPDFFRTMGIVITRGRTFTDAERTVTDPMPALVSQNTAARLWPGEDAIGKRFSRAIPGEPGFEVVGIAADARTTGLEGTPPLMVYVPYWWGYSRPAATLLVKTAMQPTAAAGALRRTLRDIDPDIAVAEPRSMSSIVDAATAGRRYQTALLSAFGVIALFIAMLGVYAVTAYSVSRRRREMNLRVALGAQPSQAVALVARQGAAPVVGGALIGGTGAVAIGRGVAALLFEVDARDPLVIGAVVVVVGGVGAAAALLAARRGLSINPAAALREE